MSNSAPRINSETFFFRDHGQFDLLRLRLLPELIEQRSGSKTLRLWSAGCASGEEAYSLAIVVDMLLPQRSGWDIRIFGSDINQAALAKARRGRYGKWSFRMAPPMLQQKYFQRAGDEWILDERIRNMVTFSTVDLIKDAYPAEELSDMDMILCRNVFIYFDSIAVNAVAEKLTAALSLGGYLMAAHTELIGHQVHNLRSRLFAEGVVHQRIEPVLTAPSPLPNIVQTAQAPAVVVRHRPNLAPRPSANIEDMQTKAHEFADRGEYDHAEQTCRQILAVTPLAAQPYFLMAQLAQLRGDFEQAGKLLDMTLYLDSHYVAAYLEQAALCERIEKLSRAQTLRRTALEIVRALPGDEVIEPYEITAAEMAQWLAQGVAELTSPSEDRKGKQRGYPIPVDIRT